MRGGRLWRDLTGRDVAMAVALALALGFAWWAIGRADALFETDPDYIYLMNGLELLTLRAPYYYTHPGIPVEMLIAMVIGLDWLVSLPLHGFISAVDPVLRDPTFYMQILNAVLAALNIGALSFFALRVRQADGRYFPALAGAVSLLLFYPAFLAIHRVDPEPLLMAAGLMLAGLLAPMAFAPDSFVESRRYAVMLGALLGFCLASKVTSAPFLVVLVLLRGWPLRKWAILATVVSAIAFTLPAAADYPDMLLWYVRLFTHQGRYGSGDAGLPPLSQLAGNIGVLAGTMPETFLCLALYIAVILAATGGRLRRADNSIKVLAVCAAVIGIDLLMVVKDPTPRYTIATVAFLCLGNAIVAKRLQDRVRLAAAAAAAVVVAIAVLVAWREKGWAQDISTIRTANAALTQKTAQSGCLVVQYYSVDAPPFDLQFGNGWAGGAFTDRLVRIYPDYLSYEPGADKFTDFAGDVSLDKVPARFSHWKCVYLEGSPLARFDNFGIALSYLAPVAQVPGDVHETVAVMALKPGWEKSFAKAP